MADNKETVGRTFTVVIVLCLVCSIIVAGSAVLLKPRQQANAAEAKQVNILATAGIDSKGAEISELFEQRVKTWGYNLDTNELVAYDALTQLDAAIADSAMFAMSKTGKEAGVRDLHAVVPVFEVLTENGVTDSYVLDLRGAGLWGMMYAFLAIEPNGETIRGIYFYEHSETPGLGGEIQNPRWTARFDGLTAVTDSGDVAITVKKGAKEAEGEVDALSGATITSNGVNKTLQFWLSEEAYGGFLAQLRKGGAN